MSSQLIALEVLFIVGLLTIFIGLPWHLVYQRRIKLGKPLLDQWSSEESTLDLLDVVLTFFCYFGVQVAGVLFIVSNPDPSDLSHHFLQMSPFNSAAGLTTLLAVFLLIPILYYRRRDLRAFRLRHDRLRELLKIGLLAAILLIPLTMAINVIVGLLVTPYSHPVIDTLLAEASVETLIYTVITVVVAAPIVEEFVFRGVVLTYLQRAFSGNWATNTLILCKHSEKPENQFKAADTFQRHGANLLTSLIFASLHLGQGAAPIPLFLLSFGIGHVANKTGSIIPCILIHMLLNGISTIPLIYIVLSQA